MKTENKEDRNFEQNCIAGIRDVNSNFQLTILS